MNYGNRNQQEKIVRELIREVLIQEGFFGDVWQGIKSGAGAAYDAVAGALGADDKPESGILKSLDDLYDDDHPYRVPGEDHDEDEDFSETSTSVNIPNVTQSSGVVWNEVTESFVRRLREVLPASIPLHITSAVRTPETQASAMIKKHSIGGAREIRKIYGEKAEDFLAAPVSVSSWASVVRDLIRQEILPSHHLTGDAIDIRTRDLSSDQIEELIKACKKVGARKTLLETKPPHLHVDSFGDSSSTYA